MAKKFEFTDEQKASMVRRYVEQGEGLKDIGETYNMSIPTTRKILAECGAPIRTRGRPRKKVIAPSPTVEVTKEDTTEAVEETTEAPASASQRVMTW